MELPLPLINLSTLEYDFSDIWGPRYTDLFKGQSHGCRHIAYLAQSADISNKSVYLLVGFPTWEIVFLSISFGRFFNIGVSMSNEDKMRTCWLRSADI